jgi:hypothetical protein
MNSKGQKTVIPHPMLLITVALIGLLFWFFGIFWFTGKVQISDESIWARFSAFYDGKQLSFEYPKSWKIQENKHVDGIPEIVFSFENNQRTYHMTINSFHTKEFKGAEYFSVDETRQYGDRSVFIKTIYVKNKPIEIVAVPVSSDQEKSLIQSVSLELPSHNTQLYFSLFDHMLKSLQYE